jgi:anti-sigma factor RsiW
MQCAEALRVQAYFDAEVDALAAADIERHIEHCAECRALLKDLEEVRDVLRRDSAYVHAPPALRANILRALDEEGEADEAQDDAQCHMQDQSRAQDRAQAASSSLSRRNPRDLSRRRPWPLWAGALGGAGGTAIAAALAFFLLVPRFATPLLDELVNAHERSLMPAHLIDVVSTDKHTVKPWFAGHADVSPAVADFEAQGYKLIGGRADYLDHQRAAVVVYQHGSHVINVFSWSGDGRSLPSNVTRNGYHFISWTAGDLRYCAVSDTGRDELLGLVRLLQDLGARDSVE